MAWTRLIIMLLCLTAAACTRENIRRMDPTALRDVPDYDLCESHRICYGIYGCYEDAEVFAELARRGLLTTRELDLVHRQWIEVGMSECALVASMGRARDTHRSVGSWGVDEEFIYGDPPNFSTHVYLRNGRVTGWDKW